MVVAIHEETDEDGNLVEDTIHMVATGDIAAPSKIPTTNITRVDFQIQHQETGTTST